MSDADFGFPPPRDFQDEAHRSLRDGFRAGNKRQVLCAPTGAGKTYLGLRIMHEALQRERRVMFICDRTSLIDQTVETAFSYGLTDFGVLQASHPLTRWGARMQIASVQTLARRKWPQADVVVIDECHTMYQSWVKWTKTTDAVVIGLSATPFTTGLGDVFDGVVNAATMARLIDEKVLTPFHVLTCQQIDMEGAETSGGEWTETAAAQRASKIVGDIVTEWIKHGQGRKTICFVPTVDYGMTLAQQFEAAGVHATCITYRTGDEERRDIIGEFRKHDSHYRILISVEALAKGFDVRDVSCVIDARPLRKSFSSFVQMLGRGLRASPETGKKDCLLLDHSGNVLRFRDDFERLYWEGVHDLKSAAKLDKTIRQTPQADKEKHVCPNCGFSPFHMRCMACGHERQTRKPIAGEVVPGQMRKVQIGHQGKLSVSGYQLWQQLCYWVSRTKTPPEKQRARAAALFKDLSGRFAPRDWGISAGVMAGCAPDVADAAKRSSDAWRASMLRKQYAERAVNRNAHAMAA